MQSNDLDRDTLRRLAQTRPGNGAKALSFYLNLAPTEFATPPARASAIRSLLDEGEKKLKEIENGHADRSLRADFQRARAVSRLASAKAGSAKCNAVRAMTAA